MKVANKWASLPNPFLSLSFSKGRISSQPLHSTMSSAEDPHVHVLSTGKFIQWTSLLNFVLLSGLSSPLKRSLLLSSLDLTGTAWSDVLFRFLPLALYKDGVSANHSPTITDQVN